MEVVACGAPSALKHLSGPQEGAGVEVVGADTPFPATEKHNP